MGENYIYVYKYFGKAVCFVAQRGRADEMFERVTGISVIQADKGWAIGPG